MDGDESITIRVRASTRDRLYALRKPLSGAAVESADAIITRLLDERDSAGASKSARRGASARSEAGVAP